MDPAAMLEAPGSIEPAGSPESEVHALRSRLAAAERALAELSERDRHLRLSMEASNVVAYQWDIGRDRVTRLRASLAPGHALEDAGTFESVVAKVLPEDQAHFRDDIAAALGSGEGAYRTEVRYRRADGTIRWLSETGRVLRDADGRATHLVGLTFDITDRKAGEEALRQAEAMLREQALRKDEFLAMLAHELRNPLAPIRSAVAILRHLSPPDGPGSGVHDIIDRQVAHLVRLVDDLLDVSRVSRGKIALRRAPLDVREVARQALEAARPVLEARGHAFALAVPEAPVIVDGDGTRLTQVLCNLLNNAAKYTDAGGEVRMSLRVEGPRAVVAVADNGRGLDAVELERVFEMFYQAERDLDRAEGGLGLGLPLVRSLVELHGGSVRARSAGRGHGCAFEVDLPLAR